MTTERAEQIVIWKHNCITQGPCNPPCDDPWQVDAPYPHGGTFTTHQEAVEYANTLARRR